MQAAFVRRFDFAWMAPNCKWHAQLCHNPQRISAPKAAYCMLPRGSLSHTETHRCHIFGTITGHTPPASASRQMIHNAPWFDTPCETCSADRHVQDECYQAMHILTCNDHACVNAISILFNRHLTQHAQVTFTTTSYSFANDKKPQRQVHDTHASNTHAQTRAQCALQMSVR